MTMKATAPEIPRTLDLRALVARKSHCLLGPRQTGKPVPGRQSLPGARLYDLLDASVYLALSRDPTRLGQELTPQDRVVVIDEIQRLPELLNEVHRAIQGGGTRVPVTGPPARGARRRAPRPPPLPPRRPGPHCARRRAGPRGSLPSIYSSDAPRADLEAYA